MLHDPRNPHVDNSTFHLFDPFSSHLLDQAKTQTPDRHDHEEVEFELKLLESEKEDDDESGIQSPPLWKNTNSNSPIVYPLSPNSRRREAIVKGQKELMDMVKNLPESCYELSLKDLVEHNPKAAQNQKEYLLQRDDDNDRVQSNRQGGSKKFDNNNNIINKGMLLKMVFPVGYRSSTRKSMMLLNNSSSSSSKGSNRFLDGNGGKISNKFWWKSSSSRSRSITSSNSNSNSDSSGSNASTRERRRMLPNCMTCFQSSKNQAAE